MTGSNPVLGDIFCVLGTFLYAISNVGQEYSVKEIGRLEWLSFLGIFGTAISSIQLAIIEREELQTLKWSWQIILLLISFGVFLFLLYSLSPIMMKLESATLFNISLLTSDIYAIFFGVFIFHQYLSFLYFISFGLVAVGLCSYNLSSRETKTTQQGSANDHTIIETEKADALRNDDLESSKASLLGSE